MTRRSRTILAEELRRGLEIVQIPTSVIIDYRESPVAVESTRNRGTMRSHPTVHVGTLRASGVLNDTTIRKRGQTQTRYLLD
jgi:hypothetical protein